MNSLPRHRFLLFASIALAGFAADLLTKAWLFSWTDLYGGNVYWLWPEHIGLQLSWNRGALFGVGQGNTWLFAAMSVLAACAVPVWLFWYGAARDASLTTALGMVMAGILGNLYDRLGFADSLWPGRAVDVNQPTCAVRDWILWQWNDQWRWPNFNIADSLLVIGAAILFVYAMRKSDASAPMSESVNRTR